MAYSYLTTLFYYAVATAAAVLPQDETRTDPRGEPISNAKATQCRCFPGDDCWPSETEWNAFNKTVGGRLIATVPLASICHNDPLAPYDAAACAELQSKWSDPITHLATTSSPMAHFFANMSCDPFTPRDSQCTIGAYVRYAVNVSSPHECQSTIEFAQKRNIRLVIRNTGHDYYGKSTGAGALALWTHNLKNVSILDFESPAYKGKALKIGAGVANSEAQTIAHGQELAVVGGYCPTVGMAGGYTQGGGHGPLVSVLGLGADQALEWEVVTSMGKHLVASPTQNSDLYWALSGGGGGTYAVVLSLTVKAHADMRVAAANLTFSNQNVSPEAFYSVIETWLMTSPAISDAGGVSTWILTNTTFALQPVMAPGLSSDELQTLLQPTLEKLRENRIPYAYHIGDFPTFYDSDEVMNPDTGISEYNIGGRFIPRSLVSSGDSTQTLVRQLKFILDNGAAISGVTFNTSQSPNVPNSVNELWRSSSISITLGLPYDQSSLEANIAAQEKMTKILIPALEVLTPGGGSYINEGSFRQPDFQQVFYGSNYEKLLAIKKKYDPNELFFGTTAVGSEAWRIEEDGRLCRTKSQIIV